MRTQLVLVTLLAVAACDGSSQSSDDAAMPGDANPDGWLTLLQGDWMLGPNAEGYFCVYATVPRDTYVKAFRPLTPLGTHHTVLTRYTGTAPDGTVPCNVGTNGQSMIYGS